MGTISEHDYNEHIAKKQEAYVEKETDKERCKTSDDVATIVVDVQQVMQSPLLEVNSQYYKSKLCTHNYTIYWLLTHMLYVICGPNVKVTQVPAASHHV